MHLEKTQVIGNVRYWRVVVEVMVLVVVVEVVVVKFNSKSYI